MRTPSGRIDDFTRSLRSASVLGEFDYPIIREAPPKTVAKVRELKSAPETFMGSMKTSKGASQYE